MCALTALPGCLGLWAPPTDNMPADALERIEIGVTTRDDVHDIVGEPDLLDHERFEVRRCNRSAGTFFGIWIFGGMYGGATGNAYAFGVDRTEWHILTEYDTAGVVTRFEYEQGEIDSDAGGEAEALAHNDHRRAASFTSLPDHDLEQPKGWLQLENSRREPLLCVEQHHNVKYWIGSEIELKTVGVRHNGRLVPFENPIQPGKPIKPRWWPILLSATRAYSGQSLVAGVCNGKPVIWDANTGAVVGPDADTPFYYTKTNKAILCMAFSPDGRSLAMGGRHGRLTLVQLGTEQPVYEADLDKHVTQLDWSPDGRWIAASLAFREIVLVDASTGEITDRIKRPEDCNHAVAFSPRGDTLAIAAPAHVELWRINQGRFEELDDVLLLPFIRGGFQGGGFQIIGGKKILAPWVRFADDGRRLVAVSGVGAAWTLPDIRQVWRWVPDAEDDGEHHYLSDPAISPDGRTIHAIADRKPIRIRTR